MTTVAKIVMLRQRILTAALLGLPALALIAWGPNTAVLGLVAAGLGVGAWEWSGLAGLSNWLPRGILVAAVVGPVLALGLMLTTAMHHLVLGVALLWWLGVLLMLPFYREGARQQGSWSAAFVAAGILTLVPAGIALVWLHRVAPLLVVYLIVLVALADTGAYFVGRYLGRRALAPNISPGKTREGLLGGVATVLLYSTLVAGVWGPAALDGVAFVLLSMVVALVSVTGDLFESILKRRAGAKDSGSLLPGHGGILDRFDSLVAAAPVFLAGLLWLALIPRVPGTAA